MRRLAALCMLMLVTLAASPRPPLPAFTGDESVSIRAVSDGATATLADGRVLRLAGIEAPEPRALAARAKAALEALVEDQPLELRYAGAPRDRDGRTVAELFAGGRWVERDLVARGLARVRGSADERAGLAALLAVEDAARRARRGIWRDRFYAVRAAAAAARDAGTWQIVAGTVASVPRAADGSYLVFGPDKETAFAAHIPAQARRLFRAANLDPPTLAGATLRVRGFIDGTTRPTMEVTFPEQIERE